MVLVVTDEQKWAFELEGYVLLPGLLAAPSAAAPAEHPGLLAAIEQLAGGAVGARSHRRFVLPLIHFISDLLTHSVPLFLNRQCDRIVGEVPLWGRAGPPLPSGLASGELQDFHAIRFQPDRPPRSLPAGEGRWANDLTVDEQRRLGYDTASRPDRACVWGLRALWAAGGGDGCVLVCPASHKSNVRPPPSMARAEELGATERVALRPGDCLLAVATTLVGTSADGGAGAVRVISDCHL
jgi:hypothetical protein